MSARRCTCGARRGEGHALVCALVWGFAETPAQKADEKKT